MDCRKEEQARIETLVGEATAAIQLGNHNCARATVAFSTALLNAFVAGERPEVIQNRGGWFNRIGSRKINFGF